MDKELGKHFLCSTKFPHLRCCHGCFSGNEEQGTEGKTDALEVSLFRYLASLRPTFRIYLEIDLLNCSIALWQNQMLS